MTDMEFLQMLSGIDEELVTKADQPVQPQNKRGFKIALIAAVLAAALLVTSVMGAFAVAVGYFALRDDVNDGSEPQDPAEGDEQTDVKPGGLVNELFGSIDWGGLKDAIENDGKVDWGAIFDVLQGKDTPEEDDANVIYSLEELEDGTWKLEKFTGFSNKYILSIPEELGGAKITVIGEGALTNNVYVNHVTIPDSVKVIESGAFAGCPNLYTVEMADSVQSIGDGAFENCTSLAEINLPSQLRALGHYAFANCKNLQSVTLPEGLTEIGLDAFAGTAITSITVPSTVTTMGDMLFSGCENLETVIFAGDAPEVLYFESATGLAPNTACEIYYMLGTDGFTEPEWNGHPCRLMTYQTEQFVKNRFKRERYTEVPMYNVEVLGRLNLSGLDEVTVLDSYKEYEAFSHVLTSERYDREYFEEFAIVLIQVQQCSSEQVLGLAGIGAQLYTTGGIYYLGLYPVVKFDCGAEGQDMTDDIFSTYVLAEVKRSDIRTDDVIRVGSVYAYDIHTQSASAYHPGLVDKGK